MKLDERPYALVRVKGHSQKQMMESCTRQFESLLPCILDLSFLGWSLESCLAACCMQDLSTQVELALASGLSFKDRFKTNSAKRLEAAAAAEAKEEDELVENPPAGEHEVARGPYQFLQDSCKHLRFSMHLGEWFFCSGELTCHSLAAAMQH